MPSHPLVDALRSTSNAACHAAAGQLESTAQGHHTLHLRRAHLGPDDAVRIAAGLMRARGEPVASLRSLSLSYNPGLTDAGAVALLNALPPSLHELGLVGCGLGDAAGLGLLRWAGAAQDLRMLCVEDNAFSPHVRHALAALGARDSLNVVV